MVRSANGNRDLTGVAFRSRRNHNKVREAQPADITAKLAKSVSHSALCPYRWKSWCTPRQTALDCQCSLLRDIFGNPFRPFAFSFSVAD